MQRESARRGFTIQHQKVALNVDLAGFVRGYTEITLVPLIPALRTINIHSRECAIHSVSVAETTADFVLQDPFANLGPTKTDDVHSFPEIKRKVFSALADADEGELSIAIPTALLPVAHSAPAGPSGSSGPDAPRVAPNASTNSTTEFAPITVVIHYSLRSPHDGIQFVLPTDTYPYRIPHAYTTPASADSARCWVPCVDSLWERHTWDFEFIVPKALGGPADDDMETDSNAGEDEEEIPVVVICTGELVEKLAHPHDSKKTIFVYSQSAPTSVQHVAFAIGPFQSHTIPIDPPSKDSASADASSTGLGLASKTPMHVFCLPGLEARLRATTSFYRTAMNFFTSEYGSYPFTSHKLVFLDELPSQRFDASTLSLVSNDVLHGDDAIEQVFDTRQSLSHALACQWVGLNIIPKTWADLWLVNGLGLYITALFLRRLFGNNEYRFRLRKDMDRVVRLDNGPMPPICCPNILEPPDGTTLAFMNIKAPLVLYILDRRLAKSGTALGLSRVLPKIFLSAISGEMTNNTISTHSFLRTCRKVSAVDVRTFSDQWIYGSGCPIFTFHANFNKKKMAVELYMTQVCAAYQASEGDPIRMSLLKPVHSFEGTMTIRIHEADGTPYEHVLDIRSDQKKYEILFNTKYKRVRRNTKRFLARKAAAAAAEAGDAEAAEAMDAIDSGFELKEWENEARRAYWMVTDWTEEDETLMNGAAYEWIRLDADFEWISTLVFEQPDYMWVSQLQRDRDVVAQIEALHALARFPTPIVSSNLTKTVLVTNYFYRVRAEAARLLVSCATSSLKEIGLLHLFKLFTRYCYKPATVSDPFRSKLVPRPNDFSDFAEYFVRKALIIGISEYRDAEGKTGPFVRRFLIDQLHYNDNSQNQFSDALYICTLIAALGRTLLPGRAPEVSELTRTVWAPEQDDEDREVLELAQAEIDRCREMDRLNPSPHNAISIAVIEWMSMLQQSSILPPDWRTFIAYTREGNYEPVRIAALEALLLNKWFSRKSLARYLFAIIASDPSRNVRRFVARAAITSLGILEAVGDIRSSAKDGEKPVLIEEDGAFPTSAKKARSGEAEMALKAIRKDAGKQKGVREIFIPTFLSPILDHDTRMSMLKLGELIFRPDPEAPPKLSIKLATIPKISITPLAVLAAPPASANIQETASEQLAAALTRSSETAASVVHVDESATIVDIDDSAVVPPAEVKVEPPPPQVIDTPAPNPAPAPSSASAPAPPAPKKKKEKHVHTPKSQLAGMNAKDVQTCRNVLKKLVASKTSYFFRIPVDPVRDHAPGYFERIAHPMDLSSMAFKLDNGHYPNREAFQSDFNLIIRNAKTYNPPGAPVFLEAEKFKAFFEKTWEQVNSTLAAMGRIKAAEVAPVATTSSPTPMVVESAPVEPAPGNDGMDIDPVEAPIISRAEPAVLPEVARPPSIPLVKEEPRASVTPAPPPADQPAPKPKLKFKKIKPPVEPPAAPPPVVASKVDPTEELEALFSPPPNEASATVAAIDADDLLGELVDEIGVSSAKPRAAPSWSSKKKEKGKDRADSNLRRSLFSPGSSRQSSPAVPLAPAPLPKPTPPPKRNPSSAASKPRDSGAGAETHPIDVKRCGDLIKFLTDPKTLPFHIGWFLVPVDPIAAGCPTYYDEIKRPMDFKTLSEKLARGEHRTMEDFAEDVLLIFKNCRQFNPINTDPVIAADSVEQVFRREWGTIMRGRLTVAEKRHLTTFLEKMRNTDDFKWFRDPVDLNLLPDYTTRVPKKDMRDLGTIKSKVEHNKYDSPLDGVLADVTLLARNAHKYNGSQDLVALLATKLEQTVAAELTSMRKSLKRKGHVGVEESAPGVGKVTKVGTNGNPSKKIRLANLTKNGR